jgi:hypothetical protein
MISPGASPATSADHPIPGRRRRRTHGLDTAQNGGYVRPSGNPAWSPLGRFSWRLTQPCRRHAGHLPSDRMRPRCGARGSGPADPTPPRTRPLWRNPRRSGQSALIRADVRDEVGFRSPCGQLRKRRSLVGQLRCIPARAALCSEQMSSEQMTPPSLPVGSARRLGLSGGPVRRRAPGGRRPTRCGMSRPCRPGGRCGRRSSRAGPG